MKPYRPHRRKTLPPPAAKPAPVVDVAAIDRINELARTARTLWYGLLSYLAFVGVTVLGVEDADFFISERQTQLPLVNVSIPTNLFFIFAPILGAAFYTYLHHHLMKLWVALARQPEPETGPSLSDLLLPWIVIDFVLDLRPGPPRDPQPLRGLAVAATILLVFIATPAILVGFWWRSMPAHDGWMTVAACGLALLLALFVSMQSGLKLWDTTRPLPKQRNWHWVSLSNTAWLIFLILLSSFGWFKTAGDFDSFATWIANREFQKEEMWWHQSQFLGASLLNFPAEADLRNVVFVEKPADWRIYQTARSAYRVIWCKDHALKPEVCGPAPDQITKVPENEPFQPYQRQKWCQENFEPGLVPPPARTAACADHFEALDDEFRRDWVKVRKATLTALPHRSFGGRDLRNARLFGAQMEGADLTGAQMEGADLKLAQMEGADFSIAQMARADLSLAQVEGAVFRSAQMGGVDLTHAQMEGVDLTYAQMEGADLSFAQMQGAVLSFAQMEGAVLSAALMEGAVLNFAQMERVDLHLTQMEGADLSGAQMEGADLSFAQMEGADLNGANLSSAVLSAWSIARTSLRSANLTGSAAIFQFDVDAAFGDSGTILPPNICAPAHWAKETFKGPLDYDRAYQTWLDAGAPPSEPAEPCPPATP